MATAAPTEAELATARLLIARSDQAKKKYKKPKAGSKGTSVDQENADPSVTGVDPPKKKKPAIAVAYVISLLNIPSRTHTNIFLIGGHGRTHTISRTSSLRLLKTMPCGKSLSASTRVL